MRYILMPLIGLAAGCTTYEPEPQYTQPNCLERAEASDLYVRTPAEREAKAELNKQTIIALGFSIDGTENSETHKRPTPIKPPFPSFPSCAAERGIQGRCEVLFDIDANGKPLNIVPVCTSPVFNREAVRAVSRAEFSPATIEGEPVEYPGVVYPMSFRLSE